MIHKALKALSQRLGATGDESEKRLLRYALGRIEDGSFGRCEKCQGPIGRHRLAAMPEANLCLTCESIK